ncbi:guanine deaminase [Candidatus Kapaibacterium sp.]
MIIHSNFLKPGPNKKMEFFQHHYLSFDKNGVIDYFGSEYDKIPNSENKSKKVMTEFIIMPGLIDLHSHITQFPAIGIGKGGLLEWLDNYIFPLEKKFEQTEYAYYLSELFFNEAIKYGTTTIVTYSNSSFEGTDAAFEIAKDNGLRVFIGNSLMDWNLNDNFGKSTSENLSITNKLISKWHMFNVQINYIQTPTYALVSSFELMQKVSEIATKEDLFIQTHLAENLSEIKKIKDCYPNFDSYTQVYEKSGVLTDKTLLAHCIQLSDEEIKIIEKNNSSIVHCPSSNNYLRSGFFNIFDKRKSNIRKSLGSDVAAGTSLSMLNEAKEAINTNKTINILQHGSVEELGADEVLWMITKGSAEILHLQDKIGDFMVGMLADFIAINTDKIPMYDLELTPENLCSRLVYSISNRYVDLTYSRGIRLH